MAVRWDIFAALVAIIGLPLMVNPATTQLLSALVGVLMRWMWPKNALCEVLEWKDVPEGFLHNCPTGSLCNCGPFSFEHEEPSATDEDCFKETIGFIFERAWVSPSRRQKIARKPRALEFRRQYIRTDRMTLRAYTLLCQPVAEYENGCPVISFKPVNEVLTAHLDAGGDDGIMVGMVPALTKHEVECIILGYPPFYREYITLSDGSKVKSPITSKEDCIRGGWIVGVGLAYPNPTRRHNLTITSDASDGRLWKHTSMADAVRRVGERLEDFLGCFPDELALKHGLTIYREMIQDKGHRTMFWTLCEDRTFFDVPGANGYPDPFVKSMSVQEWELALLAFNRRHPLTDAMRAVFLSHLKTIVLAALKGLSYVLVYGNTESHWQCHPVTRIPQMPEISGKKHIYLTSCTSETDG